MDIRDLKLSIYRRRTGQRITVSLLHIRATRGKALLQRHANGVQDLSLFTVERIFTVEEKFNNDKIIARSSREAAEKNWECGMMPPSGIGTRLVGSVL